MTEDEAKTHLCFQAAHFHGQPIGGGMIDPKCAGSQCMAWRWHAIETKHQPMKDAAPGPEWVLHRTYSNTDGSEDAVWLHVRDGVCGLIAPR